MMSFICLCLQPPLWMRDFYDFLMAICRFVLVMINKVDQLLVDSSIATRLSSIRWSFWIRLFSKSGCRNCIFFLLNKILKVNIQSCAMDIIGDHSTFRLNQIQQFPQVQLSHDDIHSSCSICISYFTKDEIILILPCVVSGFYLLIGVKGLSIIWKIRFIAQIP